MPILWVLLRSITSIPDAYTGQLWPTQFDFSHYGYVFEHIPGFFRNFTNSVVVTLSTVFITSICAATLTNDQSVRTLPVVLATTFGGFGEWAWPRISAVYIMAITPGIIAFALAQRWYMKGLLEGALKV